MYNARFFDKQTQTQGQKNTESMEQDKEKQNNQTGSI